MQRDRGTLRRLLLSLLQLAVISIVVGIVLTALGIEPRDLFYHVSRLARRLEGVWFGLLQSALDYFLIGVVVVLPIWLIVRGIGLLRGRRDQGPER
jgi:Na+/H+-dicarboxylate symporter